MYEIPAKKIHSLQQLFNRIVASRTTGDKLPKFALLAGAGCSVSSGVVSGKHIIDILQKYNYILQSDGADSELLARWNHDSETLETFIAKVEHLIHPDTLQKYINDNNEELQRQFEDAGARLDLLKTLPNSLKKQHPNIFKDTLRDSDSNFEESINSVWQKYQNYFIEELQYGFWMYKYSPVSENIQALIEEFIEYKNPAVEYYLFADLIAKGMLYNIFTTNFDDFFQEALSFLGMRARICAFGDKADVIKYTRKKPNIIKLHGDYLYNNTKNYNHETSELHKSLQAKFEEALMKFGMIVIGYSGSDYSIMSVLEELKERLDYPLYWCVLQSDLDENRIPWRVRELISNTNDSYFVPIQNFADFSEFLWRQWRQMEELRQRQADSFITCAFEKAADLSKQLKLILRKENIEIPLSNGIPLSSVKYDFGKFEKPPLASPFIAYSGEVACVQKNRFVHIQEAVNYFNNLDSFKQEVVKQIIQFIGDFVFLTTRHLKIFLDEIGLNMNADTLLKTLHQLSNENILFQYRFVTPSQESRYYIFSLAYSGDKLYKQLFSAKPKWCDTLNLTAPAIIKKHLVAAQSISVIRRYLGNIDYQITPKLGQAKGGVCPSAAFRYVNNNIEYQYLLEVVRQEPNWENNLLEKLNRYNTYMLDSHDTCLILCGEDKGHMEMIFTVYESWRLTAQDKMIFDCLSAQHVWFTEDTAFLSDNLVNTFSLLYRSQNNILALPVNLHLFFDMKMPDSECNMFENCSIIEEISDDNQSEDADASHCLSHSESTECDLEYALKDSIIKTCLALGKAGQPIKLELFALKLKENGIDYHKYGFSKLIQFLKTQSSYLSIEGIETRKFVALSEYSES